MTAVALVGATRIRFDSSLASLTVPDDPALLFNKQMRALFGDEEIGMVAVIAPDVYDREIVEALRRLTNDLAVVPGVSRTLSITNAADPAADVFDPPPLLPAGPITEASVRHLRERVPKNPIYIPNLVSADGTAAAVTVFFKTVVSTDDEEAVEDGVTAILAAYEGPGELYYTGMSHIRVQAMRLMQQDLLTFLPMSLVVMAVVLWLSFRSLRAMLLPLLSLALGVGTLVGFMGWLDVPITLPTLVLPSLLLVIGGSYAVHVVASYLEPPREGDERTGLERTLADEGLSIVVSAVTNAVGFGSLVVHPIPAIAGLGEWAVLGIMMVCFGALIGIPLTFMVLPEGRKRPAAVHAENGSESPPWLERVVVAGAAYGIDHRGPVFAISLGVFVLSVLGALEIRVDTDFLTSFRPSSEVRRAHAVISEHLAGPNPISVILTAPTAGYFREVSALRRVKDFQDYCESIDEVTESISLVDYLEELDLGLRAGAGEGELVVNEKGELVEAGPPPSFWDAPKEQLPQILQLVSASPRTFSGVVDTDFRTLHITLRTTISGSAATEDLRDQVLTFASDMFPRGMAAEMTGTLVIMSAVSDSIISGQVSSLWLAFAAIFAVLAVMFLSARVGFAAIIPNVLPVAVFFGVMGWFGIELNLATSIIGATALGMGVDETIHYMARLNRVVKTSDSQRDALLIAMRAVGRPLVATSITMAAGYGVMIFSGFTVISAFGWLSALTMLVAMLTNLVLLPSILATVPVISVWDLVSARLGPAPHQTIPLFRDLGRFSVRLIVLLGQLRRFAAGSYIVRKGEPGREMYLVLQGHGEVQLDGGIKVPLARGGIVGEMALLRQSVRGADVVALSDVEALVIDEDFLRRLRIRYPRFASKFFVNIARILSDRLEAANRRAAT